MNTWNEFVAQRRAVYPDILADHQAGMGGSELSAKYGISRQRINRILKKFALPATPQRGGSRSLNLGQDRGLKHDKKLRHGRSKGKNGIRSRPPAGR